MPFSKQNHIQHEICMFVSTGRVGSRTRILWAKFCYRPQPFNTQTTAAAIEKTPPKPPPPTWDLPTLCWRYLEVAASWLHEANVANIILWPWETVLENTIIIRP